MIKLSKGFLEIEKDIETLFSYPKNYYDLSKRNTGYIVENKKITNILLWEILKELKCLNSVKSEEEDKE